MVRASDGKGTHSRRSELVRMESACRHRQATHGFGLRRLVLEDVPVLGELAVFDADDVGGDPGGWTTNVRKAAVSDDVVTLGKDQLVLIAQRLGSERTRSNKPVNWRPSGAGDYVVQIPAKHGMRTP